MKKEIVETFVNDIKLKPLSPELAMKKKQDMECLLCGNIINVTAHNKLQSHKKTGMKGCPSCSENEKYRDAREKNYIKLLKRFHLKVSREEYIKCSNNEMVTVINKDCSHKFTSKLGNLLNRDVECPICNRKEKQERMRKFNG